MDTNGSLLERVPLDTSISSLREDLPQKAEELLGYPLLNRMTTVLKVLEQVGARPFTNESVDKYAARKVEEDKSRRSRIRRFTDRLRITRKGGWQWSPLKEYDQEIPGSVLLLAVEIKEKLPEAELRVTEFTDNDPFMSVVYCGKEFYFAVWGEPDFRADQLA